MPGWIGISEVTSPDSCLTMVNSILPSIFIGVHSLIQMNFRPGECLLYGTVLFGVKCVLLKCCVVVPRNLGFGLKLNLCNGKRLARLFQFHSRAGVDTRRRDACARKLRG